MVGKSLYLTHSPFQRVTKGGDDARRMLCGGLVGQPPLPDEDLGLAFGEEVLVRDSSQKRLDALLKVTFGTPSLLQVELGFNHRVLSVVQVESEVCHKMWTAFGAAHGVYEWETMYHGTTEENAVLIAKYGMRGACARRSMLGNGLYASKNFWGALRWVCSCLAGWVSLCSCLAGRVSLCSCLAGLSLRWTGCSFAAPRSATDPTNLSQHVLVLKVLKGPTAPGAPGLVDFGQDADGREVLTTHAPGFPDGPAFCIKYEAAVKVECIVEVAFLPENKMTNLQCKRVGVFESQIFGQWVRKVLPQAAVVHGAAGRGAPVQAGRGAPVPAGRGAFARASIVGAAVPAVTFGVPIGRGRIVSVPGPSRGKAGAGKTEAGKTEAGKTEAGKTEAVVPSAESPPRAQVEDAERPTVRRAGLRSSEAARRAAEKAEADALTAHERLAVDVRAACDALDGRWREWVPWDGDVLREGFREVNVVEGWFDKFLFLNKGDLMLTDDVPYKMLTAKLLFVEALFEHAGGAVVVLARLAMQEAEARAPLVDGSGAETAAYVAAVVHAINDALFGGEGWRGRLGAAGGVPLVLFPLKRSTVSHVQSLAPGVEVDGCSRLRRVDAKFPGTMAEKCCPYVMEATTPLFEGRTAVRLKPNCERLPDVITFTCRRRRAAVECMLGGFVRLCDMKAAPQLSKNPLGYEPLNGLVAVVEEMACNKSAVGQARRTVDNMIMVRVAVAEGSAAHASVVAANLAFLGCTPCDWTCAQSVFVWVSQEQVVVEPPPCPYKLQLWPYRVDFADPERDGTRTRSLVSRGQFQVLSDRACGGAGFCTE